MRRFLIAAALVGTACSEREPVVTDLSFPVTGAESADPSLARDPDTGDLLVTWVGGDSTSYKLYFTRSSDTGVTWSAPVVVAEGEHEVHPHGESSPRLVAGSGGRLAATWANSIPVPGRQWPAAMIRFARSLDGGLRWSAPVTLNDDTTGALVSHQFHGAAWAGDSGLVVAWLDERKGSALAIHHGEHDPNAGDVTSEPDAMIYLASSRDFGHSWTANVPLWGQVCPCCRVTLAREADGRVVSAWRKHYPGNIRDVVVVPVGSGAEPERVHQDGWVYPGCPHTGPGIAPGANGERHVAWYMGKEGSAGVYYRKVGGAGDSVPLALVQARTLPTAHTSVVALPDGGALAAYDIDIRGDRRIGLTRIDSLGRQAEVFEIAGSAGGLYPQLVEGGAGTVLLAWTGLEGGARRIRLARITFPAVHETRLTMKE